MKIEDCTLGQEVVYRPGTWAAEYGVVVRVNTSETLVFVRYRGRETPQATHPSDLEPPDYQGEIVSIIDRAAEVIKSSNSILPKKYEWETFGKYDARRARGIAQALATAGLLASGPVPADEWRALITAERERQIAIGYDYEHDYEHGVSDLPGYAIEYGRQGKAVKAAAIVQAARDLLAAPEPRMITTIEELDVLPNGTLTLDRSDIPLRRMPWGWCGWFSIEAIEPEVIESDGFPLIVLYAPKVLL